MYKAKVNQQATFDIDINTFANDWDIININDRQLHILKNGKSYNIDIAHIDAKSKTVQLQINGQQYTVAVSDKMDLLLEKMGISNMDTAKVNEIVAPMPGLVLDVKVAVGDTINKGDAVLILEAMKMENMLKSPGEGIVKSIEVKQGEAVEKGQVLVKLG